MTIQASHLDDSPACKALCAAAVRIQSIGHIHDALQATDGADLVDIGVLVTDTCKSLQAMAGDPNRIAVLVDVGEDPILAPVGFAQPLLLAINELVVNALRHAFPNERVGVVGVSIRRSDEDVQIVVVDDGVGLPATYGEGQGFGMKLVRMMTSQVFGELYVSSRSGANFTIFAPLFGQLGGVILASVE